MLASFVIIFREGFEMAIVITLLMAATVGMHNRSRWILGGTAAGVFLSLGIGAIIISQPAAIELLSSKLTSAGILIAAALLIGWTVIWMKSHGKNMSQNLKQATLDIKEHRKPLASLAVVAFLAVFREGVESVIFILGLMSSGDQPNQLAIGGLGGAVAALIVGYAMYKGLIKLNIGKVFDVCAILMAFLAAGMAVNAAGKLVSADVLPAIIPQLWDSTAILDHHTSMFGRFLFVLFGYTEKPSLMQAIAYVGTLVIIYCGYKWQQKRLAVPAKS